MLLKLNIIFNSIVYIQSSLRHKLLLEMSDIAKKSYYNTMTRRIDIKNFSNINPYLLSLDNGINLCIIPVMDLIN